MIKKLSKILNRNTKRSARKTVGVLTLIMAIVVASLPTPRAKADPASGSGRAMGISYPDDMDDRVKNNTEIAVMTPPASAQDVYQAQTIFRFNNSSSVTYELWNLFNFYLTTGIGGDVPGGDGAVISAYNSAFTPQNDRTLTVPHNIVLRYPTFSQSDIDAFFAPSAKGDAPMTDIELEHYYPNEWAEYKRDKDAYDADPTNRPNPDKESYFDRVNQQLGTNARGLSESDRRTYFCWNSSAESLRNMQSSMQTPFDYTLVEVSNKTTSGSGVPGTSVVYIPFNQDKVTGGDFSTGFWANATDKFSVVAIGDGVFRNVTNIRKLVIETGITHIGNSAFEGSSIENVQTDAQVIGNRAFKDCTALRVVDLGSTGPTRIGIECFYGCYNLSTMEFPGSIKKIGVGAFAECANLSVLDMSSITPGLEICDFAFYNCTKLDQVNFAPFTNLIGDGAFAVAASSTGWANVTFPDDVKDMGDYVMANRNSLRTVTLPDNLGNGREITLGEGFFYGCPNLECVTFPENCKQVKFTTDAFASVTNPDFIIRGPELDRVGDPSLPRQSAWAAGITYVYKDHQGTGAEHWEAASEIYRYQIDENGVLVSCVLLENKELEFKAPHANDGLIVIPAKVGETTVTGIGPSCFSADTDKEIFENMKTLRIEDGSNIQSIDVGAFKGFPKLEAVYIGDSVNSIGVEAFKDCTALKTVVFSKPKNGYGGFTIGADAFATGGDQLTFYGDIVSGYAPFEWAMDKTEHEGDAILFGNYMNESKQMRICYRSGTPEYPNLTVILDNDTREITLIDYPHYEDLKETTRAKYEKYLTGIYDLDEIALDADESRSLNNVLNIVIPDGVESIDVAAYLKSNNNSHNASAYLAGDNYSTYRLEGLFRGFYGKDSGGNHSDREYPAGDDREKIDRGNDRVLTVTMGSVKRLPDRAFESCENLQSVVLGSAMEDIGTAPFTGCTSLTSVGGNGTYTCENGIIYGKNDEDLVIVEALASRGSLVGSPSVNLSTDPNLSQVSRIAEGAFENCTAIMNMDLSSAEKLKTIPRNCFQGSRSLMTVLLPDSVDDIRDRAFADTRYLSVQIPAIEVDIADNSFENAESVILNSYKDSAVENYAKRKGYTFMPIDRRFRVQFLDYDGTVLPITDEDGNSEPVQYVLEGRAAKEPEKPTRTDGYIFDQWDKSFTNITSDMVVVARYKWDEAKYPNSTPGILPPPSPTPAPATETPGAGTPGAGTPGADSSNKNTQKYRLTVDNGSGDGSYYPGTSVIITADKAPDGQRFDKWTSIANDFNITSATSSITTITMPTHDMTIVANYASLSSTPTPGGTGNNGGNSGNSGGSGSSGNNGVPTPTPTPLPNGGNVRPGATVDISKPGISNGNVASAIVQGSTDNYVIKISDTAEARAAVEAALINEYGSLTGLRYFAMDISLYDESGINKIQDTSNLAITITMPIPDELRQYAGNNQIAGVVNGNVLDKYSPRFTTIGGVPCISFKATHFSPYTIYVNTSHLSGSVIDDTPKTGDPIHPKWFLAIGLACISMILLLKKDKKQVKTA